MILDFSPIYRVMKKLSPATMGDQEIAKDIARCDLLLDNKGAYAMTVASAAYFTFPIVGWGFILAAGTLAVSGTALLVTCAATYGVYKGGEKLLCKAVTRAVLDKNDLEAEQDVREVKRRAAAEKAAQDQMERDIALIRAKALQAKEDFNKALNDGLPLEQAIKTKKSPLKFKSQPRASFMKLGF